jgi:hypothetical protein
VNAGEGPALVAPKAAPRSLDLVGGEGGTSTYTGALVMWDDALKAEDLAALLTATRRYNETSVAAEGAFDAYARGVLEPRKANIAKLDATIRQLRGSGDVSLDAQQVEKASGWFDAALAGTLSSATALDEGARSAVGAHAGALFTKYCEAQVWSYAFNDVLAREAFVRRPSPNALCEGVYAELGLFDGAVCADAPAGRNYYACIWREGVARTSFYGKLAAATRARLSETLSGDAARALVANPGQSIGIEADCSFATLRNNVLNMALSPLRCAVLVGDAPIALGMVRLDAGVEKPVPPPLRNKSLDLATPPVTVEFFHGSQQARLDFCAANASDICHAPRVVTSAGSEIDVPEAVRESLVATGRKVEAFMKELGGCDKVLRAPNDAFFNATRLVSKDLSACAKPSDVSALPDVFVEPDRRVEKVTAERDALLSKLNDDEGGMCGPVNRQACREGDGSWLCRLDRSTADKFRAVFKPGVSQATFRNFTVNVRRPDGKDGIVTLDFGKGEVAAACLDVLGAKKRRAACGVEANLAKARLRASHDPSTGRLVLEMPIAREVLLQGFLDAKGRFVSSDERREVGGLLDFVGKTLWIELYPSLMNSVRPYLSGKALVKDGAREVAQGTASYLLDAGFDVRFGQYCAAAWESARKK